MKGCVMIGVFLIMALLTSCTPNADVEQEAARIEQALPEEYEKQMETKTYLFQLTNGEGSVVDYYLCESTYYAMDPAEVTGLNTHAFAAVFDVENAQLLLEFDSCGHPAAIYKGYECHYACCTGSPESSVVMAYDPEQLSDETAVLIIRSIYEGAEVAQEQNRG